MPLELFNNTEGFSSETLKEIVKKITQTALDLHTQFDEEMKEEYEAAGTTPFHSSAHIMGCLEAWTIMKKDELIKKMIQEEINRASQYDRFPKHVLASLGKPDLIDFCITIALAYHDIGNIAQIALTDTDADTLAFLERYTSQGAEERSKEIVTRILKNLNKLPWKEVEAEAIIEFVCYLIDLTKFNPNDQNLDKLPFEKIIQFTDQVASAFFRPDNIYQAVKGLKKELEDEGKEAKVLPPHEFVLQRTRLLDMQEILNKVILMNIMNSLNRRNKELLEQVQRIRS